jgi:hypothetical protein
MQGTNCSLASGCLSAVSNVAHKRNNATRYVNICIKESRYGMRSLNSIDINFLNQCLSRDSMAGIRLLGLQSANMHLAAQTFSHHK